MHINTIHSSIWQAAQYKLYNRWVYTVYPVEIDHNKVIHCYLSSISFLKYQIKCHRSKQPSLFNTPQKSIIAQTQKYVIRVNEIKRSPSHTNSPHKTWGVCLWHSDGPHRPAAGVINISYPAKGNLEYNHSIQKRTKSLLHFSSVIFS